MKGRLEVELIYGEVNQELEDLVEQHLVTLTELFLYVCGLANEIGDKSECLHPWNVVHSRVCSSCSPNG